MSGKSFYNKVYDAVLKIPKGKVATYGQVAAAAGNGGAARAVGNALHVNPLFGVVPCHRVVNAKGMLAPGFCSRRASLSEEQRRKGSCLKPRALRWLITASTSKGIRREAWTEARRAAALFDEN